ncbi:MULTISPECIES: glycogen synthase [Cellulophaga]|uniref:starch synthase n=1 Tax=Cellulophaga baltica 18 TaxID=1348584 RepID=A0AAU8R7R8_9FLAO|nr:MULTISPECIES: glycogen/starch synthase [Cellulophaga]AIZ40253.1 glycogen synthase [Cellulophaga baltica 18]KGK29371.1 glycogen synthase [Cellulophaga sp. E6(2014)]MBA6314314.1 glycogen synthase [Cellulophaga baltica]
MNNFLFVAAENDAIPKCKAGGMGDVVRDVPRQISRKGDSAHIVVPAYSRLHREGTFLMHLNFQLRGQDYTAELYRVQPKKDFENLTHYVIHHPEIQPGDIAHIYHNDPTEPFFNDAVKYFIFCTAVAEAVNQNAFGDLDIVHLHDWHSSLLLFLRKYHPSYEKLKQLRFVYTIHNLAIQGIRPFGGNYSSIQNFFPEIPIDYDNLRDHRYWDCINLMAVGVRLADAVHTVSPSYKEDILVPSNPPDFIGGESLEADLQNADLEGRLFGILNGSNYNNIRAAEKGRLYRNIIRALFGWLQEESKKYKYDFLAHTGEKIMDYVEHKPDFIVSSVARLTEQKFYYIKHSPEAFIEILEKLAKVNGVFMLLGTGAPEYEEMFREISYKHKNFIFTNGQSEDLIDSIYLESDLYFMPSLFEPCGISQMLAMRNGHPCLVHHTGGLKDTVQHLKTGFSFDGTTTDEKIRNMVDSFDLVLDIFLNDKPQWKKIKANAKKERFTWDKSVDEYYKFLYAITI